MIASSRRIAVGAAVLALLVVGPAAAQENLDHGKTPAQLYAANCAICHKSPRGLSRVGGMFGLQGFLREHYTASKDTAAAIAAYLVAVDREAPSRTRATKRAGKPRDKSKSGEAKSEKPAKDKGEAKGSESTSSEAKPSEPKQSKPAEAKPTEAKPVGAKADAAEPAAKPAEGPKPEKSNKSD